MKPVGKTKNAIGPKKQTVTEAQADTLIELATMQAQYTLALVLLLGLNAGATFVLIMLAAFRAKFLLR